MTDDLTDDEVFEQWRVGKPPHYVAYLMKYFVMRWKWRDDQHIFVWWEYDDFQHHDIFPTIFSHDQ